MANNYDASSLSSWTDEIPKCKNSGLGMATNELYHGGPGGVSGLGRRVDEFQPFQDRSFHFHVSEFNLSFLGIFDGFNGIDVSDLARKKMPADILLGQVSPNSPDESVKDILRTAFNSIDSYYVEGIDESLAQSLTKSIGRSDNDEGFPDKMSRAGCSATVALIIDETRLFIGNVGNTRALLCLQSPHQDENDFKVIKLSIDHVLGDNEDEELRLRLLGLDINRLLMNNGQGLADNRYTRCLGYYRGKSGFRENVDLKYSKEDPIISDPEIQGPIMIEKDFLFMIICSDPLRKCLSEIGIENDEAVDNLLCRMTYDEFKENNSVSGVAQSVVDKIVRMHREYFDEQMVETASTHIFRQDISVIVRNFNCQLKSTGPVSVSDRSNIKKSSFSSTNITNSVSSTSQNKFINNSDINNTMISCTTEGSSSVDVSLKQGNELPVDENGRIKPYVDFTYFYDKWNEYCKTTAAK